MRIRRSPAGSPGAQCFETQPRLSPNRRFLRLHGGSFHRIQHKDAINKQSNHRITSECAEAV